MNASEIRFGVEIETHIAIDEANGGHVVGRYHAGVQVPFLPMGWKAEHDGSIRGFDYTVRRSCEYVSPVLEGIDGLRQLHEAATAIRDRGARVNSSCGVHVTVTFPANDAAALARLICIVAHYERALYATTGTTRRETGGYSYGIRRHGRIHRTNKAKVDAAKRQAEADRYHMLNLTHLARGQNRVEFRLFSGSTNPDKLVAWVRLVLAIVELALVSTRAASFEPKHKSQDRLAYGAEGFGEKELRALFYKLGWRKHSGWKRPGGRVMGEVVGEGLPSLEASCNTLLRLAKKYDQEVAAAQAAVVAASQATYHPLDGRSAG